MNHHKGASSHPESGVLRSSYSTDFKKVLLTYGANRTVLSPALLQDLPALLVEPFLGTVRPAFKLFGHHSEVAACPFTEADEPTRPGCR